MQKLEDILIEIAKEEEKYFTNYLYYSRIIKKIAQKVLKECKVYVFGSILNKKEIPRDIDIMIISPKLRKEKNKKEIIKKIWEKLGRIYPFEIHFVTPDQWKDWYRYFVKKKKEIK